MNAVVVYKSKYGSTRQYAQWIAEALQCEVFESKSVKASDLASYDTIIYGGGLYAEVIAGVTLITKNMHLFHDKKIIVFTTGITPLSCHEYYNNMVIPKNFKGELSQKVKVFHFLGKMILEELTPVHRTAIKALKKLMSDKKNPTPMEQLLVRLCDCNDDYTDKNAISELLEYVKDETQN